MPSVVLPKLSISNVYAASPPQVEIKQPSLCLSRYQAGQQIQVSGITSDNHSTVRVAEVQIQSESGVQMSPYQTAVQAQKGDWSGWTVTLNGTSPGHRIVLAHTVDMAGQENWDQVKISVVNDSSGVIQNDNARKKSVAVLEPVFTEAAYGFSSTELGNFYAFYSKYNNVGPGTDVRTDLNLLTGDIPREPDHQFSTPLVQNLRQFDPSEQVTLISDIDVNDGYIFDAHGNNLYDAIFLLHDEYITTQEYGNYEKFVKNGGNIVALDGNIFYAQVKYDPENCAVTLVQGHDWQFDGEEAHRSVSEKFQDENRKFIGSNFVVNDIRDPVTFGNNPFNYTHFEENYVSNSNDTVLVNYGAKIGVPSTSSENARASSGTNNNFIPGGILQALLGLGSNNTTGVGDFSGKQIATYELQPYGSDAGRIVMMGIYSQNLLHQTAFLRYLQNVIFPISFGEMQNITIDGTDSGQLYYKAPERYSINSVKWDANSSSVQLNIAPVNNYVILDSSDMHLDIVVPNQLFAANNDTLPHGASVTVKVDGRQAGNYTRSSDNVYTGISLDMASLSNRSAIGNALYPHQVEVDGLETVPDFPDVIPILLAAITIVAVARLGERLLSRLGDSRKEET